MTIDKTLYISLEPLKFENNMHFFLLAFKHLMIIVLITPTLETLFTNISEVKYHFVVRFLICNA